jgi:hypothetical protein
MLAGDGENMLIGWADSTGTKARRMRLSDGTMLDAADLPLVPGGRASTLTLDGESFNLAWFDSRDIGPTKLVLTRIARTGALLDTGAIPVATLDQYAPWSIGLSAGGGERVLVAYDIYDSSAEARTNRVRAHLLSELLPPGDAGVPADAMLAGDGSAAGGADAGVSDTTAGADATTPFDTAASPTADASSAADGAIPLPAYDAAAERPGKGKSSGGCQLGGRPPSGVWALVTLGLMIWRRRRR